MVRKLRIQHGWSQEHLAEISGLSVRTIQRIEGGKGAGLESYKSLAAVFEVDIELLQEGEPHMTTDSNITEEEKDAIEHVKKLKSFYQGLTYYIITLVFLTMVNLMTNPGYLWVIWVAIGWGIAIAYDALNTFKFVEIFDTRWEKKQIEKRLGRPWERPAKEPNSAEDNPGQHNR